MRVDSPFLAAAVVAVAIAMLAIVTARLGRRLRLRGAGVSAVCGLAVAALATWLVCDVFALIPVDVPFAARAWFVVGVALMCGGFGIACARAAESPAHAERRHFPVSRTLAVLASLALIVGAALGVNSVFGVVRTTEQLASTFAGSPAETIAPLAQPAVSHAITESEWTPPSDMPSSGTLMHVNIPGTTSGFAARNASVWLPPAAQVANPPSLPVVLMLSGQPGSPDDVVAGGGDAVSVLEQIQSEHHGLAPIVVSPDQLGAPEQNPMCVDGALGNSRSYLEHDVIPWIQSHLPVASDRTAWTFAGFSQGATCTMQIGLDLPDRFASNIAISPELAPSLAGDPVATVSQGFAGNAEAWESAKPAAVIGKHTPYNDTTLVIGTGELDKVFSGYADELSGVATKAGIETTRLTSPGTSHDFNTVHYIWQQTLPTTLTRAGVTA